MRKYLHDAGEWLSWSDHLHALRLPLLATLDVTCDGRLPGSSSLPEGSRRHVSSLYHQVLTCGDYAFGVDVHSLVIPSV